MRLIRFLFTCVAFWIIALSVMLIVMFNFNNSLSMSTGWAEKEQKQESFETILTGVPFECPFDNPLARERGADFIGTFKQGFRFHVYHLPYAYSDDIINRSTLCSPAALYQADNHFCDAYIVAKYMREHPCHTEVLEDADSFVVPLLVQYLLVRLFTSPYH